MTTRGAGGRATARLGQQVVGQTGRRPVRPRSASARIDGQAGQVLAALGRGDERAVGHLVGHRLVTGMADAGPDRGGRRWRWPGPPARRRMWPGRPWSRRPAPPREVAAAAPCEPTDGGGHRAWRPPGPGPGSATTTNVERHARRLEAADEVAIALGSRAGHQADPQRQAGHGDPAVPIEETFVHQGLDQTGPLGGHLAQQGIGVQLREDEADVPPGLVELHLAPDPDHQAGVEGYAQLVECGPDPAPSARPAHHLQHGRARCPGRWADRPGRCSSGPGS